MGGNGFLTRGFVPGAGVGGWFFSDDALFTRLGVVGVIVMAPLKMEVSLLAGAETSSCAIVCRGCCCFS